MSAAPLFSLVTVTLNSEKTLPRTVESVRSQTFRDFEYIVIDGGSTDGTLAYLQRQREVVRRLTSGPDRGISDAFNKGLDLARGDFVGFVNADDWYEPNALEVVARAIGERTADVYCGKQRYWSDGAPTTVFEADPRHLRRFMSVNHIASFARRSLFGAWGGFKEDYKAAMDYELYLRFFARGARFEVVDAVLANMSLGGVSDRKWRLALDEVRQAQRENGSAQSAAWANWAFQRAKGESRRWLERTGAGRVVELYRTRLARVKRVENVR